MAAVTGRDWTERLEETLGVCAAGGSMRGASFEVGEGGAHAGESIAASRVLALMGPDGLCAAQFWSPHCESISL